MKKLAKFADRATEADGLYFEHFPCRHQRIRLSHRTEIEQVEIIDGEPMIALAAGIRMRAFTPNLEGSETNRNAALARQILQLTTPFTMEIEARPRKLAGTWP